MSNNDLIKSMYNSNQVLFKVCIKSDFNFLGVVKITFSNVPPPFLFVVSAEEVEKNDVFHYVRSLKKKFLESI
ncbi:MAG: hypothetical protein DRO04_03135 [Candidatus Iainarchaeum archaeon]|uniref:Uncharacterized protein n=1 Tax=Candidatus Iainarchaeum sp. TaxID=3101447 RepID=A0A497JGA5_9ARCH|nr:MAG: hypothetical protein DRO04_03135 [Candidatus Diapherotrites archaeon]